MSHSIPSSSRLNILNVIFELPRGQLFSSMETAVDLGISKQAVNQHLTALRNRGLISYETYDTRNVILTEKGINLCTTLKELYAK